MDDHAVDEVFSDPPRFLLAKMTGDELSDSLLDEATEYCCLRDYGDMLRLEAYFVRLQCTICCSEECDCMAEKTVVSSQTLTFDASRKHPEDLQEVLRGMGMLAGSESGIAFSWHHAAILSKWFRREFYRASR